MTRDPLMPFNGLQPTKSNDLQPAPILPTPSPRHGRGLWVIIISLLAIALMCGGGFLIYSVFFSDKSEPSSQSSPSRSENRTFNPSAPFDTSIDSIELGMSDSAVSATLDSLGREYERAIISTPDGVYFESEGFSVFIASHTTGVSQVYTGLESHCTLRGICLGDSMSLVEEMYGKPTHFQDLETLSIAEYFDGHTYMRFQFEPVQLDTQDNVLDAWLISTNSDY
ncbi:MAG: hypothetical protein FWG15_05520 [Propionibacteriaceae bacterium]|nr:hypothetical protein [Propionibacteriaceae bacterium]